MLDLLQDKLKHISTVKYKQEKEMKFALKVLGRVPPFAAYLIFMAGLITAVVGFVSSAASRELSDFLLFAGGLVVMATIVVAQANARVDAVKREDDGA